MEEALYSDLGFFNTDQVRSDKEGDFLTSPEVSKYFGKIIRNWIHSESNLKNIGNTFDIGRALYVTWSKSELTDAHALG